MHLRELLEPVFQEFGWKWRPTFGDDIGMFVGPLRHSVFVQYCDRVYWFDRNGTRINALAAEPKFLERIKEYLRSVPDVI